MAHSASGEVLSWARGMLGAIWLPMLVAFYAAGCQGTAESGKERDLALAGKTGWQVSCVLLPTWQLYKTIDLSRDGDVFLVLGMDSRLLVVVGSGREQVTFHDELVCEAVMSSDGHTLVVLDEEGIARGYGIGPGLGMPRLRDGHAAFTVPDAKQTALRIAHVCISADGKRMFSLNRDSTLWMWDFSTANGVEIGRFEPCSTYGIRCSPGGDLVAVMVGTEVWLWDVEARKVRRVLPGDTGSSYTPSFSPDGQRLLTLDRYRLVRVWDVASGNLLYSVMVADGADGFFPAWLCKNARADWGAALLPDGRIVTWNGTASLTLWDPATSKATEVPCDPEPGSGTQSRLERRVMHAGVSGDGSLIVVGHMDGTISLWRPTRAAKGVGGKDSVGGPVKSSH